MTTKIAKEMQILLFVYQKNKSLLMRITTEIPQMVDFKQKGFDNLHCHSHLLRSFRICVIARTEKFLMKA